jgi:hypothetical protein
MSEHSSTSEAPSASASMAKIASSLERVLDGFRAETADRARERKVISAIMALGFASVLGAQAWLASKSLANATRIAAIASAQEEQSADLSRIGATATETREAVEEAKAEVAASPRIEVAPPTRRGDKPTAVLVIPARPSKAATAATPSAAAVASSAPAPAASIPLSLPAGTTGGAL